ncbi:hypothetical protein Tco_0813811 [Tanacetum coccineum]
MCLALRSQNRHRFHQIMYLSQSTRKEDPEEDPADYPADGGDDDDEFFEDDADDDDEEEASEEEDDDDEEEEHLALAGFSAIPVVDPIPLAEYIKAFETDESTPTPPSPRPCKARIFVRFEPPVAASIEARIAEYATAPTPLLPPPSPFTPLSSPLPLIPLPPLLLPSPPTHTSLTYAEAPLAIERP